jgi:hypothetical protein
MKEARWLHGKMYLYNAENRWLQAVMLNEKKTIHIKAKFFNEELYVF